MHFFFISLTSLISLCNTATAISIVKTEATQDRHANHLFNAIHSSTRQWGSTLNHNGMSFFLASIPTDAKLYRGSWALDAMKCTERLALEPELARMFAMSQWATPKSKPSHEDVDKERPGSEGDMEGTELRKRHKEEQIPFIDNSSTPDPSHNSKGYLYTYSSTRPLRLLYIDGLSAVMTKNGTLDTQDILLLDIRTSSGSDSAIIGDAERVHRMCELATSLWNKKIDGFLRMKSGLEVILCKFESRVKRINVEACNLDPRGQSECKEKGSRGTTGGWSYIKTLGEHDQDLRRETVVLNYEKFVSVFAYDRGAELGLWQNDAMSDKLHPRLINSSPEHLKTIRDAVTDMILESDEKEENNTNWQVVTDKVVERYALALHHMHTDVLIRSNKKHFASYLESLIEPFIIPSERDTTLEMERCIAESVPLLPPHSTSSTAHMAIHSVTSHICSTLISTYNESTLKPSLSLAALSSPPYRALDLIDTLVKSLQWTVWKECGPYSGHEVCPISA